MKTFYVNKLVKTVKVQADYYTIDSRGGAAFWKRDRTRYADNPIVYMQAGSYMEIIEEGFFPEKTEPVYV